MTEPTRDALHAETLEELRLDAQMFVEQEDLRGYERYAYAAECVKRVPELEAEVVRLRAKAEIVDAMERGEIRVLVVAMTNANWCIWRGEGTRSKPYWGKTLLAAYAAATREGTDAG